MYGMVSGPWPKKKINELKQQNRVKDEQLDLSVTPKLV